MDILVTAVFLLHRSQVCMFLSLSFPTLSCIPWVVKDYMGCFGLIARDADIGGIFSDDCMNVVATIRKGTEGHVQI